MVRMINPVLKSSKQVAHAVEKWIYYNTIENNKESYVFKNKRLISYQKSSWSKTI